MPKLRTLPDDAVRQIMWGFADRFDLQMAVQSARSVARTTVAHLVADGQRNNHEWTERKAELLTAFDQTGLTSAFMEPSQGGFIEGPKNMVQSLIAFELAWVDAGAATSSMASNLALSPIHEKGTDEQRDYYMSRCVPPQPGEDREIWRGAFALTEPLPYVGVDTGVLAGKISVAEWKDGEEPMIKVEKRGRFITGMPFADFVTVAVDTGDERIKTSCMVVVEKTDPGLWDAGSNTLKMVHQLSATSDPVISVTVPASRIIGGYEIVDGKIVPTYTHGEIIGAVFHHTRVPVGIMSSAKLLSAIEPVIRYQRQRFRGGEAAQPGSPRFDLGLQQKDDANQRLIDVWATGEAGASLGFHTARLFDLLDPATQAKDEAFAQAGVKGLRKQMMALRKASPAAIELVQEMAKPEGERDQAKVDELSSDPVVNYLYLESEASVLCPACKLWNPGTGAAMMREAVALVGGYGVTEDCPGFLPHKWFDTQLEATYEGPECVQRRQLTATMADPVFLAHFDEWTKRVHAIAHQRRGVGASVLSKAMQIWKWTFDYLQKAKDEDGKKLFHNKRHGVTFPLADALAWLLGPKCLLDDILRLEAEGPANPVVAEGLEGLVEFYLDLFHVQAARAAGEVGRICAELVFGYRRDAGGDCACAGVGIADKPCPQHEGLEEFVRLRAMVDGCMTGVKTAKESAAEALTEVMIPEALDYPM